MGILENGIWIAIIAHSLDGASLVWDKVLLERPDTQNVPSYVFWLGAMSIFGLILMFFGFHLPTLKIVLIAFSTGIIHLAANFFYYAALKRGEASQALAIMGGLSPAATALIAIALLKHPLGENSLLGFTLMVAGGFFMFFAEQFNYRRMLPLVLLAAVTFGLTNVMQKVVFNATNFVSGYVVFTFGTFVGSLLLLLRPKWRKEILTESEHAEPKSRLWYFVNRFVSGVGSFLIFLAISRANPAIVDAISGIRYVIIFAASYLITKYRSEWLREQFGGWALKAKVIGTGAVVAGLVLVGLTGKQVAGEGSAMPQIRPRPRWHRSTEVLAALPPASRPPLPSTVASAPLPSR
jgi:drug/metabolite transporter (DMT)-like permease